MTMTTSSHNDSCETALKKECDCECGGRFHGIKSMRRIDEFFPHEEEDDDEIPLTPDEEAELKELEAIDWDKEYEKEGRRIKYWIHTRIREFKRDGMTRETFYNHAKRIEADLVRDRIITPADAIMKLNEYMRVFDEQERR